MWTGSSKATCREPAIAQCGTRPKSTSSQNPKKQHKKPLTCASIERWCSRSAALSLGVSRAAHTHTLSLSLSRAGLEEEAG